MICERPATSTGLAHNLNITKRLQKNPMRRKVLEENVNSDLQTLNDQEVTHNIQFD